VSVQRGALHDAEPAEAPALGSEVRNAIYVATQVERLQPKIAAEEVGKVSGLDAPKASDVRAIAKGQRRTGTVAGGDLPDNLRKLAWGALGPESGHSGPGKVIFYLKPARYGGTAGQGHSAVLYVLHCEQFQEWMQLAETLGSDGKVKLVLTGGYVVIVFCVLLPVPSTRPGLEPVHRALPVALSIQNSEAEDVTDQVYAALLEYVHCSGPGCDHLDKVTILARHGYRIMRSCAHDAKKPQFASLDLLASWVNTAGSLGIVPALCDFHCLQGNVEHLTDHKHFDPNLLLGCVIVTKVLKQSISLWHFDKLWPEAQGAIQSLFNLTYGEDGTAHAAEYVAYLRKFKFSRRRRPMHTDEGRYSAGGAAAVRRCVRTNNALEPTIKSLVELCGRRSSPTPAAFLAAASGTTPSLQRVESVGLQLSSLVARENTRRPAKPAPKAECAWRKAAALVLNGLVTNTGAGVKAVGVNLVYVLPYVTTSPKHSGLFGLSDGVNNCLSSLLKCRDGLWFPGAAPAAGHALVRLDLGIASSEDSDAMWSRRSAGPIAAAIHQRVEVSPESAE
jgi:hypothetical protein